MIRSVRLVAALSVGILTGAADIALAGAGNIAAPFLQSAPEAAGTALAVPVNHRRPRGGGSITFHFGGPGYYYGPRYYVPRYYEPRVYYRRHAPRHYRVAPVSAHVRWCSAKYRSYRAWDNSFQPYRGGRRECVSPYY
ncbi:MAG: BA14K family protein [Rhizobiaceae bacterium]|nr:BA14K family protein [Rhizobiaceae bacterium]